MLVINLATTMAFQLTPVQLSPRPLAALVQPRVVVSAKLKDKLRLAGAATLAALTIVASPTPALAKGGGGGGGGGGGSRSSYSRRSGKSSSSMDLGTTVIVYGGMAAYGTAYNAYTSHAFKKAKERQEKSLDELETCHKLSIELDEESIRASTPASGVYRGTSSESDRNNQDIFTRLRFHADGSISGEGRDSEDGGYRVTNGRWTVLAGHSQPTFAWTERYAGFDALVQGSFYRDGTKLKAGFISSRGVRGKFFLSGPKRPVATPRRTLSNAETTALDFDEIVALCDATPPITRRDRSAFTLAKRDFATWEDMQGRMH